MSSAVAIIDIPVEFGGVSIGENTARLGLKISRDVMSIERADETFSGHRLTGKVVLGGSGDESGQTSFVEDLHTTIDAHFDVNRFSVNATHFGAGLTFSKRDIELSNLGDFSKKSGRFIVDEIQELPDENDYEGNEVPGALAADGPWAKEPLSNLFKGKELKVLNDAKLITVGDLGNYTATSKLLTDLDGCGPKMAERIEEQMMAFWAANPDAGAGDE